MSRRNNLLIYISIFIFFIFSILSLYNAQSMIQIDNLIIKQIIWYILGIILILIIKKVGNKFLIDKIIYVYIFMNILLLLLLIFGKPVNNSKCWFEIPGIGTFQPSEFMKIVLIIYIAKILSKEKLLNIKDEFKLLIKIFLLLIIPSILTFLEPDTGVVIMYLIITILQLFISGLNLKWFIGLFLFILLILSFIFCIYSIDKDLFVNIFGTSFFLRIDRILDWSNKSGYQLENSLISIGSSGLLGFGFRLPLYFPEPQTDFIFSTLSSSFGYIGSFILILFLIIFDLSMINIAIKSKEKINKYIITGFTGVLIYQQIQNISMTFGLLPITGITLPFISYGGSSLLSYMIMIGIVLNIQSEKKK